MHLFFSRHLRWEVPIHSVGNPNSQTQNRKQFHAHRYLTRLYNFLFQPLPGKTDRAYAQNEDRRQSGQGRAFSIQFLTRRLDWNWIWSRLRRNVECPSRRLYAWHVSNGQRWPIAIHRILHDSKGRRRWALFCDSNTSIQTSIAGKKRTNTSAFL